MPFTDLGTNILAGGNVSEVFTLVTGQRLLASARNSYINFHNPHDDHPLSGPNQSGWSTAYPTIVPFNDGFLSMQAWTYNRPDPDYSPVASIIYKFTAIDQSGNMLWEKDASLADLDVTIYDPTPTYTTDIGQTRAASAIAGNMGSRILYRVDAHHSPDGGTTFIDRYFHLDFDAFGNFTRTFAFDVQSTPSPGYAYSMNYMPMTQKRVGSGWVAWGRQALFFGSQPVKLFFLTDDLDLVDSPALPAASSSGDTYYLREIVQDWDGDGLWLVDSRVPYGSGDNTRWAKIPITFDGVNPAAYGTTQFGNSTLANYPATSPRTARGFGQVNNWSTGSGPKPADYWNPADGTSAFVMPNTNNMEWALANDVDNGEYGPTGLVASIVTDWYGGHTGADPYNGDTFSNNNFVLRLNVGRFDTKTAGFIDLKVLYPVPAAQSFSWGTGYRDADLDEAAYSFVHPINGRVLILAYHYWTLLGPAVDDGGVDYGQSWMSAFWIGQMGPADIPPAPSMPAWYNAFGSSGSSGGGVAPASEGDCIRLGQGTNDVYLYDRGGARQMAKFPLVDITMLRWTRKRDDISECTMRLTSPGSDCCQIVRQMQVGRHELVVYRDGVRSWEGPITRISYGADWVEVEAHDICHYLTRTIMRAAYDNRYRKKGSRVGPITKRLQTILQHEMIRKERLNPSYNILKFLEVRTHAKTTRTSRYTPQYYSSVWEELDYAAAKLSLDYTVIGRRLLINDVHDVIGRLPQLTDKDFTDELIVTSYGMELATRSAVTDGEGHWAAVGTSSDPYYGEVELLNTTYGEAAKPVATTKPTKEELKALTKEMTSQAQRNLAGRYPIPTVVRIPDNTQLSPEAPLKITDLVPGVRVPIRATLSCLELEQEQKLDFMQVEQSGSGEKITITLSPAPGTTPWDDSSETGED